MTSAPRTADASHTRREPACRAGREGMPIRRVWEAPVQQPAWHGDGA
jgi:hypothetical protein